MYIVTRNGLTIRRTNRGFDFCAIPVCGGVSPSSSSFQSRWAAYRVFRPRSSWTSYGLAVTTAALSITVYMVASALGMVGGAWLVMRRQRLEQNITLALTVSVIAAVLIGFQIVPGVYTFALMAIMGFGSGLSGPSRDMMIRHRHAGSGATGRVYGVVYSGLDIGLAIGPFAFGKMLDHGFYAEVFFGVAVCLFVAVLTAWRVAAEERMESFARKRAPTD